MTALVAAFCFLMGLALGAALFVREMRRQARFLERRDPRGAERARALLPGAAPRRLARALNACLDETRRESQEARRLNDELMRSLSDLSHDIRTPLAAAKGHLQLYRDAGAPQPSASAARLDAALSRIDATTDILDQLLELAKASDPDRLYDRASTPLLPLLVDALTDHELELDRLGWEPLVSFQQEGVRVEADEQALKRILENLVGNALRYGQPPLSCVQSSSGEAVALVLSNGVEGGGVGDPSLLFERFYRRGRSRTGVGTGLGLPIAKALAEGMGMRLSAEAGEGVVSFKLEMSRPAAPRP